MFFNSHKRDTQQQYSTQSGAYDQYEKDDAENDYDYTSQQKQQQQRVNVGEDGPESTDDVDMQSSSEYGTEEQVDYANEFSPYTVGSILGEVKTSGSFGGPKMDVGGVGAYGELNYLFRDEEKLHGKRGWNEKICYNTGVVYALGLTSGGLWGFYEAMKAPVGNSSKLRLNAILNGCTRRGPLIGNSAAVCTMFYTTFAHGFEKLRDEDDLVNHVAAGALAGGLFKSTAGVLPALKSAGLFGGLAAIAGMILLQKD